MIMGAPKLQRNRMEAGRKTASTRMPARALSFTLAAEVSGWQWRGIQLHQFAEPIDTYVSV